MDLLYLERWSPNRRSEVREMGDVEEITVLKISMFRQVSRSRSWILRGVEMQQRVESCGVDRSFCEDLKI